MADVLTKIERFEAKIGHNVDEINTALAGIKTNRNTYLELVTNIAPGIKIDNALDFISAYDKAKSSLNLTNASAANIVESLEANAKVLQDLEVKKIVIGSMEYNYPTTVKVFADKTKCYIDEGFCFTSGTPVLNANGTTKAIDQVQPGDTIQTYDHAAKHNTPGIVKRAWARTTNKLCRLVIGGVMLLSTPEHPIFANNGYIQAKDLQYGDSILTANGSYDKVESVALFDSTATVYNLEVARQQNYYAGNRQFLVHNNCAWLTIRQGMVDDKLEELFKTFSNNLISGKFSTLQRKNLYDAIAQLGTNKKAFLADFAENPDMLKVFVENPKLVESWKAISHKPKVRTKIEALESLQTLRSNSKLANKLPGKSTSEIDELLGKMEGWGDGTNGASYKQVCDKVNELVNDLPDNVTNLEKFLGSSGFGNANVYTKRHSYVQLERILNTEKKAFLKSADEIILKVLFQLHLEIVFQIFISEKELVL